MQDKLLYILDNKQIIRINATLDNLLSLLDNKYKIEYVLDEFERLHNLDVLDGIEEFNKKKIVERDYINIVIDWEKITNKQILTDSKMAEFIKNHYTTYLLMYKKSMFLNMLDYYNYFQPSQLIFTLDNIIFTILSEKKGIIEDINLSDIYSNLLFYLESLPFRKVDYYMPDKYNDILIDLRGYGMKEKDLSLMKKIYQDITSKKLENKSTFLDQDDIDINNY